MAFTVYAQAEVLMARLTLAPRAAAGAIETTIMAAIHAGANTADALADILGLAPRLVLQVLGDLWRAGRISISLGTEFEALSLTTAGEQQLDEARGEAVPTTSRTVVEEEVLLERLTGRALPFASSLHRVPVEDRDLVVPTQTDDRDPADLSSDELAAALAITLARRGYGEADAYGNQRVVSAFLKPAPLRRGSRRRYVQLRVAADVSATGEITLSVLEDRLSISERRRAAARLQAMLDAEPRSRFANRVRQRAGTSHLELRGIDEALTELDNTIKSMETCGAEHRQQRHDKATDLANKVVAYARTLAAHEMDVQLVSGADEHAAALVDLFTSAERQLVLAVPWIRQTGLEVIRGPLLAALERGVRVVLVWGIEGAAKNLGQSEALWLDTITATIRNRAFTGELLYSRVRAARSHAKVVVADDRRMLVTSKNYLSGSDRIELGVLLSAIGNQSSPTIQAALQYVHDKAPEPRIAAAIRVQAGSFGARDDDLPFHHLQTPRLIKALLEQTAPLAAVRAWSTAWQSTAAEARDLLDRPRPTVELVTDLRHRGVLRNAFAKAETRVLLISDRVTGTALTEDIAAQAAARVREGLTTVVRYGQATGSENRGLDHLVQTAEVSTALSVENTKRMHAKVVLCDDTTLVTSFNPLSVDADLRAGRATGELGAEITSGTVADAVWATLRGAATSRPANAAPKAVKDPTPEIALALIDALESAESDGLVALIQRHGAAAVFDAHDRFGLDDDALPRLAGAALGVDSESMVDLTSTAQILVKSALTAGNWGVALLLRQQVRDSNARPRTSFLTALHDGASSGEALLMALTGSVPPDLAESTALMIVDCVAQLLNDHPDGRADLEQVVSTVECDNEDGEFVKRVIAYCRRFGPFPSTPPRRASLSNAAEQLQNLWAGADQAYFEFANYDSHSAVGDAFLAWLLEPGRELANLGLALTSRDGVALLTWKSEFARSTDDKKWLDRTVQRAGLRRIVDHRRRPFLELRRSLRIAVIQLCAALESQTETDQASWPAEQLEMIDEVIAKAGHIIERLASDNSPEAIVSRAEVVRVLCWSDGSASGIPLRDWTGWSFVNTFLATRAEPHQLPALSAIGSDLAVRWTPDLAVKTLADAGEFERAEWICEHLGDADHIGIVASARTRARDVVSDQLAALRRRCERAGVDIAIPAADIARATRLADLTARVAALEELADSLIEPQFADLTERLDRKRDSMSPNWAEYVTSLIKDGEFLLADRALKVRDGVQQLPHPKPFVRWIWRDRTAEEISRWYDEAQSQPAGIGNRRLPMPTDPAGRAVIAAIRALGQHQTNAKVLTVEALQRLLLTDDEHRHPGLTDLDAKHSTATLQIPYDQRLPRLRWVGADPSLIAVGPEPVPGTLLRLALDTQTSVTSEAVVDLGDILSLLCRSDTDASPTASERAMQFLSIVCSRLNLDAIIEPREIPAEMTESSRRRLTWLLFILGISGNVRDIDRLAAWAGGHSGVLWCLIDEVRKDSVMSIGSLSEGPHLDEVLISGVDADLERDEDLLVLALGHASGLLVEGCTEPELVALFEDEWNESGRSPDHRITISHVIHRLIQKGYLVDLSGRMRSCGCRTALAIERTATHEWLESRMDLVDPVQLMAARAYDFIVEMVRHQYQAGIRPSDDEIHVQATKRLNNRLTDYTPFDLVELCSRVSREYRRQGVDVIRRFSDGPLVVADAGPAIWVECLIIELLNNAMKATAGLPHGEATVRMYVDVDPNDDRFAVLRVRNNGLPVPAGVREAFQARRRLNDPRRPGRGTGLYRFRSFGETRNVSITLADNEAGETVVTCRIPLSAD